MGLFVAWDQRVEVKQIWTNEFCSEIRISSEDGESDLWMILVYASTDPREKHQQWKILKIRKQLWG